MEPNLLELLMPQLPNFIIYHSFNSNFKLYLYNSTDDIQCFKSEKSKFINAGNRERSYTENLEDWDKYDVVKNIYNW